MQGMMCWIVNAGTSFHIVMLLIRRMWSTPSNVFSFENSPHIWIGLDLFSDDTCPSGHISRPTKVNVSQELFSFSKKPFYTGTCVSELLSFSKQSLKSDHIVHAWELVEVNRLHHIKWKNPASRRNSTMQVSGIVSKRAFNESTV